jgi:hypothetical protein
MRDIVELVGKDSASGNGATMPNGNGSAADNAAASNGSGSGSSAHVA